MRHEQTRRAGPVPSSLVRLLLAIALAGFAGVVSAAGGILANEAKLTISDPDAEDWIGHTVAIDGDTLVIGATHSDEFGNQFGTVYVFERGAGAGEWNEIAKISSPAGGLPVSFGKSLAISGDVLIVGAKWDNPAGRESGSAYVFHRDQGGPDSFGLVKKLIPLDASEDDYFGASVAVSGNMIIVGAYGDDGEGRESGSAYLFRRNAGGTDNWGQVRKLIASDAETDDLGGYSVGISGDTAIVGAPFDNESGRAYIFERDAGGAGKWGEVRKLAPPEFPDFGTDEEFGIDVAISGDAVIVGAATDSQEGRYAGSASVYERNQGGAENWGFAKKLVASDAAAGDFFGISVAISGDRAIVGAPSDDDAGDASGSAYVYDRNACGGWGEVRKLTASSGGAGHAFGIVAISGEEAFVGTSTPFQHLFHGGALDACGAAPQAGCIEGWNHGQLVVRESVPGREKLTATLRGAGAPLALGGSAYQLCLYDALDVLVGELRFDGPAASCEREDRFRSRGTMGASYRGSAWAIDLRNQDAGARLRVAVRNGPALAERSVPVGIAAALQDSASATLQVLGSPGSNCLSIALPASKSNRADLFKAKK